MHATFDLKCGHRVYVSTDWINNFMELAIGETKPPTEGKGLWVHLHDIIRTEARAIASALMGGAAELNNPIKENPLVECWCCKGTGTKTYRAADGQRGEGPCSICDGSKVTLKYHPNNSAEFVPWINPEDSPQQT